MTMKRIFFISSLILIFILLLLTAYNYKTGYFRKFLPVPAPSASPRLPSPRKINPQGDTVYRETREYQIMYTTATDEYLITILGSPFTKYRQEAELVFLRLFTLSADEACALKVVVGTTQFSNPESANQVYGLSFCEK